MSPVAQENLKPCLHRHYEIDRVKAERVCLDCGLILLPDTSQMINPRSPRTQVHKYQLKRLELASQIAWFEKEITRLNENPCSWPGCHKPAGPNSKMEEIKQKQEALKTEYEKTKAESDRLYGEILNSDIKNFDKVSQQKQVYDDKLKHVLATLAVSFVQRLAHSPLPNQQHRNHCWCSTKAKPWNL